MTLHEAHKAHRIGWLRAAVLGANDGIVSTASLIIGVAAASTAHTDILLAGMAGLVAGAMSMAAGEYVSVSSQADTEKADLAQEKESLAHNGELETLELAKIYEDRGVQPGLARQVAEQLMARDALGAHVRDEIGISSNAQARPIQAAVSSASTFTLGAALPLAVALLAPGPYLIPTVATLSLFFLAVLGTIAAKAGGAHLLKGASRVAFWGALAMAATAVVGKLFGVAV